MRFFAVALFFIGAASYAQTPEVPHKMHFADMTLTIRDDARREIQKDVDALTKYPRYFNIKVERAKTYFPIIEKIFEEERLPDDFKYLVLQESALISDAVSVSNAVGFWQFKDFTALEMGLRVDKDIDERMNIASATRGAARYLKKNNYLFNNWLLALQSYQMGGGGVQRSVGDKYNGVRHMEITSETYWYIKKYLAHKIAFENSVKGEPQVKVVQYQIQSPKAIKELASEFSVDEPTLLEYNKWARAGKIPADKPYLVLIPAGQLTPEFNTLILASTKSSGESNLSTPAVIKLERLDINGVPAVRAIGGETTAALASRAGVSLSDFLKYNDISIDHRVENGAYYFLKRKKTKSDQPTHSVVSGDNLWAISQQYGVRMARLKRFNKLTATSRLKPGDVVWLIKKKPFQENTIAPVTVDDEVIVAVEEGAFFGWEVKPNEGISSSTPVIDKQKEKALEIITPVKTDSIVIINNEQAGNHLVKQGETLYAISKNYGIAVTDLLAWNDLNISAGIKPGQYLKVKAPILNSFDASADVNTPSEVKIIIHEVKPADTLYSVARQYNVTIKELMDWNKKEDLSLSLGEKIKILSR
jgi:membrane-bound lytic murein transglycosylase D